MENNMKEVEQWYDWNQVVRLFRLRKSSALSAKYCSLRYFWHFGRINWLQLMNINKTGSFLKFRMVWSILSLKLLFAHQTAVETIIRNHLLGCSFTDNYISYESVWRKGQCIWIKDNAWVRFFCHMTDFVSTATIISFHCHLSAPS